MCTALYSNVIFLFFFVENYIDGKEFLQLSQQDLKEMIPAIGIVKKLLRLISKVF